MSDVELGWIGHKEAIRRLEAAGFSAPGQFPSALVDWAESGIVDTIARSLLVNGLPQEDRRIPAKLWEVARKGEAGLIDWRVGYIQGRVHQHAPRRTVEIKGHGVQFNAEQLDQFAPAVSATPSFSASPSKNRGGAKRSVKWNDFMAELAAYIHLEGVPPGKGTEGSEAIIDAVLARLQERGFDETLARSTVQPTVNAVLIRLRADE